MSQSPHPDDNPQRSDGDSERDFSQELASELESELDTGLSPSFEAEYELEEPVRCPQCRELITSFGIVRAIRRRVNFVSTLPRRGFVAVCSECRSLLPAGLSGLL